MIPKGTMQPSIARTSEQLDFAMQLADIPLLQSHILFISHLAESRRLS